MLIAAVQLLFNVACGFSGCSLLDAFALTTYNLLWTFVPGVLLVLDADRGSSELLAEPRFYHESSVAEWLTPATLAGWSLRAALQAAVLLGIPAAALGGPGFRDCAGPGLLRGDAPDPAVLGYAVYAGVLVVQVSEERAWCDLLWCYAASARLIVPAQMLTLAFEMRTPTRTNLIVNAAALVVFASLISLRNSWGVLGSDALGVGTTLAQAGSAWAAGALAVVIAVAPWVMLRAAGGAGDAVSQQAAEGKDRAESSSDVRRRGSGLPIAVGLSEAGVVGGRAGSFAI